MHEPKAFLISNPDVIMTMGDSYTYFGTVRFRNHQVSINIGNKEISARKSTSNNGNDKYSILNESGSTIGKVEVQSAFPYPIVKNWIRVLTVYDQSGNGIYAGRSMKTLFGN